MTDRETRNLIFDKTIPSKDSVVMYKYFYTKSVNRRKKSNKGNAWEKIFSFIKTDSIDCIILSYSSYNSKIPLNSIFESYELMNK